MKLADLVELKKAGNIIGIVGNWGLATRTIVGWQHLFSFIGPVGVTKELFLHQLKTYIPADEYIHVGNVFGEKNSLGFTCGSHDSEAALIAGFRFIKEDDFVEKVLNG